MFLSVWHHVIIRLEQGALKFSLFLLRWSRGVCWALRKSGTTVWKMVFSFHGLNFQLVFSFKS